MTSNYREELFTGFHHDRDHHHGRPSGSSPPVSMHPSKPSGSTRFLVILLQALVMSAALFLFFLFAGIAAVVLLHLFVAGRALRRRRLLHHEELSKAVASPGLSQEELRRLPCSRCGAGGRGSDCAVCLEGIREGDRFRVLPGCKHAFHKACVDKWLVRSRACPICRAGVCARG